MRTFPPLCRAAVSTVPACAGRGCRSSAGRRRARRSSQNQDRCILYSASSTFLPLCSEGATSGGAGNCFFFFFFKPTGWKQKGINSSLLGLCRSRKMAKASLGAAMAFVSHRISFPMLRNPQFLQRWFGWGTEVVQRGCSSTRSGTVPSAPGDPHALGAGFWRRRCGSCGAALICHPRVPTSEAAQDAPSLGTPQLLASGRIFLQSFCQPSTQERGVLLGCFFFPSLKSRKKTF